MDYGQLYKKTKIGYIPKEWEVLPLSEHCSIVTGFAFRSYDYTDDGIQLIRISNLFDNKLSLDREPIFLPYEFEILYSNFLLKTDDLIMSMTGTFGKRDYGFVVKIPN